MAPIGRHVSQAQRLEEGFGSMSEMGSIAVKGPMPVISAAQRSLSSDLCWRHATNRDVSTSLDMTEEVLGMTGYPVAIREMGATAERACRMPQPRRCMAVKRMRERRDMALRAIGTTQGPTLRMQCAMCCMGSDPARWPG